MESELRSRRLIVPALAHVAAPPPPPPPREEEAFPQRARPERPADGYPDADHGQGDLDLHPHHHGARVALEPRDEGHADDAGDARAFGFKRKNEKIAVNNRQANTRAGGYSSWKPGVLTINSGSNSRRRPSSPGTACSVSI